MNIYKYLHQISVKLLCIFIVLNFFIVSSHAARPLLQQGEPRFEIIKVDMDSFPDVKVYIYAENLGVRPDSLEFEVWEGNKSIKVEIFDARTTHIGTRTAFVLHESNAINEGETSGKLERYVRNIVFSDIFVPDEDLMLAGLTTKAYAVESQGWTQNFETIVRTFSRSYSQEIPRTPLFEPLDGLLNSEFATEDGYLPSIVLFSDGIDKGSDFKLEDVTSKAKDEGIKIHAVLLPTESNDKGKGNLTRLAKLTGGTYTESLDNFDTLKTGLMETSQQQVITFRSQTSDIGEVYVRTVAAGKEYESIGKPSRRVDVYPVSIEFPKLVERTVSITATQGEPKTFPIELKFRWTDEHTRAVREVNYKIGHVEKAQNNIGTAITTTLNIAIADLKPGNYQLVIGAVGDLGMPSDEETIAVQIKESVIDEGMSTGIMIGIGVAVVIILGLIGLTFYYTRSGGPKHAEPKIRKARAELVLKKEVGGIQLPSRIRLNLGDFIIGRRNKSDLFIDNSKISRDHCRITEVGQNYFKIYDTESKLGTHVNGKKLDNTGRLLQAGDEIKIGPVVYVFEPNLKGTSGGDRTEDQFGKVSQ